MEQTPVLEVDRLAVAYRLHGRELDAVRDVTFQIRRGETLGMVGESGCGKSTVAYSIVGFLGAAGRIKRGAILFKGQALQGRSFRQLRSILGDEISMVYQEPMAALNPMLKIKDQLVETLQVHRSLSSPAAYDLSLAALKRVHMPDCAEAMERYPHQVSGGQQQQILIAMAILNNPALLIMDEPTTSLDVTYQATVLDLVSELKAEHDTAVLYISHSLGVIARVADRVAVMYAGELVEVASSHDIYHHPVHPFTRGLIRALPDVDAPRGARKMHPIAGQAPQADKAPAGCIFAPRCEHSHLLCTRERPLLLDLEPGHSVRCVRADLWQRLPLEDESCAPSPGACPSKEPDQAPVLQARELRAFYSIPARTAAGLVVLEPGRDVRAVDGVSLSAWRGRTLGIVGESGCGKTTLAKAIVGLESLRSGEMEFLGVDLTQPVSRRSQEVIRELQLVFQDPNGTLNPAHTVGAQIAAALNRFKVVPPHEVMAETIRLLKAVKLDETYYRRLPGQMSGGEKQRIGIARAIASSPALLVCDEPVSTLDVSVQAAVLSMLMEIQQRRNMGIILIAHDLGSVRAVADDVAVMYAGQIVETGRTEEVFNPPNHPYAQALLAAAPRPDPDLRPRWVPLSGTAPSPIEPPPGCRFHPRCPRRIDGLCESVVPPAMHAGGNHLIHCHLPLETLSVR